MDELKICQDSVVAAVPNQVSANLDEESIILDFNDEIYYGLNSVGSRIWELLQKPRSVREILEILLEEYEVKPGPCREDLFKLLRELASRNLIDVQDVQAP